MPSLSYEANCQSRRGRDKESKDIQFPLDGKNSCATNVDKLSGELGAECSGYINCAGFRLPGLATWSRVRKCGGPP